MLLVVVEEDEVLVSGPSGSGRQRCCQTRCGNNDGARVRMGDECVMVVVVVVATGNFIPEE